ncbi:unnamed protein product [Ascophyllum nodosum]
MSTSENAANTSKRKNLTTAEKRGMIDELLKGSNNGILQRGDLSRVADMYQQHRKTVGKYWRKYSKQKAAGVHSPDLHNRRKGNSGQKGVDITALVDRVAEGDSPEKPHHSQVDRGSSERSQVDALPKP